MDVQLFEELLESVKEAKRIQFRQMRADTDSAIPSLSSATRGKTSEDFMRNFTPDEQAHIKTEAQELIASEHRRRYRSLQEADLACRVLRADPATWARVQEIRATLNATLVDGWDETVFTRDVLDRADILFDAWLQEELWKPRSELVIHLKPELIKGWLDVRKQNLESVLALCYELGLHAEDDPFTRSLEQSLKEVTAISVESTTKGVHMGGLSTAD